MDKVFLSAYSSDSLIEHSHLAHPSLPQTGVSLCYWPVQNTHHTPASLYTDHSPVGSCDYYTSDTQAVTHNITEYTMLCDQYKTLITHPRHFTLVIVQWELVTTTLLTHKMETYIICNTVYRYINVICNSHYYRNIAWKSHLNAEL